MSYYVYIGLLNCVQSSGEDLSSLLARRALVSYADNLPLSAHVHKKSMKP